MSKTHSGKPLVSVSKPQPFGSGKFFPEINKLQSAGTEKPFLEIDKPRTDNTNKTLPEINAPLPVQLPQLRNLWKEAFGDSDAFLDIFASTAFSTDRCRCVTIDGKVAAALYWFDCSFRDKPIAYIYAVATAKAYRGKGLCHRLMENTHKHLAASGYIGAILVPGSKGLFQFYEGIGYRTCSYVSEIYYELPESGCCGNGAGCRLPELSTCENNHNYKLPELAACEKITDCSLPEFSACEKITDCSLPEFSACEKITDFQLDLNLHEKKLQSKNALKNKIPALRSIEKEEYARLRRQFLPEDGIIQEKENLDFLETQAEFFSGNNFLLAASKNGTSLHGVELLGDTSVIPEILQSFSCTNGTFRVPGDGKPFGMYYSFGEAGIAPKYLGFAFD